MPVPFIDLSRSVSRIKQNVLSDWEDCLNTCTFIGGRYIKTMEEKLKNKLQVNQFIGCSNGTDALVIGLQALGIKPGMKVAVPNMTFWASYEAIVLVGATPVIIDIDPDDLQMSFDEFRKAHDKFRFEAALTVHLYGWPSAKLQELRNFCKDRSISLLEDGAQSFGAEIDGESVYKNADISTISFYPAKVLGAGGDAGGITCATPALADRVRCLINHGRKDHYSYEIVGSNSRANDVQAAFISRMTDEIDEAIQTRLNAENFYKEFFKNHTDKIKMYCAPNNTKGNGYLTVFAGTRKNADEITAALKAKGIGCARTYPETIDQQPPAKDALRVSDLKVSKDFIHKVFNLPQFAWITPEECNEAATATLEVL